VPPIRPPLAERIPLGGLGFAVGAYLLWGVLPILFFALRTTGAVEIVSWRILFALVFCLFLLAVSGGWRRLLAILRDRTAMLTLGVASFLILINWLVYVFASISGHVVEASLGYFTNPIVTVLLGVVILRERLRVMQWIAIAVSAIAVLVIAIGYGAFPWIAIVLAVSFGLYGLVKQRVGSSVDAISGLTVETAILSPLAAVALIVIGAGTGLTFASQGGLHTALLVGSGVATAVPLLLFAAAARRLPLVYLGLIQYIAPLMQLIIGVYVLGESMSVERWIGFGIVWLALAILTTDMVIHGTRQRASAAAAGAAGAP
jgi:chloramphenicol-sensitive protein RarD